MEDTLDPPGTLAVVGGGPLGIEAALYGRYLGYTVTVFEADETVHRPRAEPDASAPEKCTSPLGLAAIAAQRGQGATMVDVQPETTSDWATEYFDMIAQSDLLQDRIRAFTRVQRIELASDSAADEEEDPKEPGNEAEMDVPPDFLIHYVDDQGVEAVERVEAVIDARGDQSEWIGPGDAELAESHAYLFRIGGTAAGVADFTSGLDRIREIYAQLWGRPSLDVYANLGG